MFEGTAAHWNSRHPDEEPIDAAEMMAVPRAQLAEIDKALRLDEENPRVA